MINLGSEDNSDELATDEGLQASETNTLNNEMEKGTLEDDHNPNVKMDYTVCDLLRSTAMMMKNQKQEHNALKAMKQWNSCNEKRLWKRDYHLVWAKK